MSEVPSEVVTSVTAVKEENLDKIESEENTRQIGCERKIVRLGNETIRKSSIESEEKYLKVKRIKASGSNKNFECQQVDFKGRKLQKSVKSIVEEINPGCSHACKIRVLGVTADAIRVLDVAVDAIRVLGVAVDAIRVLGVAVSAVRIQYVEVEAIRVLYVAVIAIRVLYIVVDGICIQYVAVDVICVLYVAVDVTRVLDIVVNAIRALGVAVDAICVMSIRCNDSSHVNELNLLVRDVMINRCMEMSGSVRNNISNINYRGCSPILLRIISRYLEIVSSKRKHSSFAPVRSCDLLLRCDWPKCQLP